MKIVFNDGSELQIQSAAIVEGKLQIKTISANLEELRDKFEDAFACKKINIVEREQVIVSYEGYTKLYRLEQYTGAINGVVMEKEDAAEKTITYAQAQQMVNDAIASLKSELNIE